MKTKELIRQEMLNQRNLLTTQEIKEKSKTICDRIINEAAYQNAETLLLFASFRNEVDTNYLFNNAKQKGKNVYYPKIIKDRMQFYKVSKQEELKQGYMGILEPEESAECFEKNFSSVLVIVPGLAFDKCGNRLGYGKGYYDRFLEENPHVETIAPAYDFQVLESIAVREHDKKIHCIITESNKFKGK